MSASIASNSIHLGLHGTFRASDGTGAEILNLSRRGQAILAILSQQPNLKIERTTLADLLWSDRGPDQARASLRQELSVLRKRLPDGLLMSDRQCVSLQAGAVSVGPVTDGQFLQGFDIASEGFEDWLRAHRTSDQGKQVPDSAKFFARPTVLLFGFEAMSSGEHDAMIASGLADDLRTTLSYWRWFPVIGPEAISWKTAQETDLRAVAGELDAAYAVTGSLRRVGNEIRINVGLVDTATGRTVWAENFAGSLEDIFAFQEGVSRMIVAQLEPQIAQAEAARIQRTHPASVAPWQLMAMADDVDRKGGEGYGTRESNFEQIRLMEKALEQAEDFAPAYARIGRIYFRSALLGWLDDRKAAFEKSLSLTQKAIQIDPDSWEAHAYQGVARVFGTRDFSGGRFHGYEAVRLNPSAALARHAVGCALECLGYPEESLEHLSLVFRLNPNFPGRAAALGNLATCEMLVGNRDGALDAAYRLLAIAPGYARGLQRCAAIFGYFNQADRASEAMRLLFDAQPGFDEDYVRATYPYERPEDLEVLLTGLRKAGAFNK